MEIRYHTLDVFTDRIFGGNPLAVFPDAAGIDDGTMQRVARELNLSESVFLTPPRTPEGTRRVRIFTPVTEVPFAGHPTVGTAYFLAASGAVEIGEEGGTVVLEEGVGPVEVAVEVEGGLPSATRLTAAGEPEHRPLPWSTDGDTAGGRARLAEMVSLPEEAIGFGGRAVAGCEGAFEPEVVSAGLPFVVIPVRDLAGIRRARLDTAVWERLTREAWSRMIYLVCPEAEAEGVDQHVRMFAPGAGVPEDPATGSAAAALGAWLGRRSARRDARLRWRVEQGLEIGRPSLLEVDVEVSDGSVRSIRVGGRSVLVGRGVLRIPAESER